MARELQTAAYRSSIFRFQHFTSNSGVAFLGLFGKVLSGSKWSSDECREGRPAIICIQEPARLIEALVHLPIVPLPEQHGGSAWHP